jgi:hypothetical protein
VEVNRIAKLRSWAPESRNPNRTVVSSFGDHARPMPATIISASSDVQRIHPAIVFTLADRCHSIGSASNIAANLQPGPHHLQLLHAPRRAVQRRHSETVPHSQVARCRQTATLTDPYQHLEASIGNAQSAPQSWYHKEQRAHRIRVGFQNLGTPVVQDHSPQGHSPHDGWNVAYAASCCPVPYLGLNSERNDSPLMTRS